MAANTEFVGVDGINFIEGSEIKYFTGTNNYYQMMHRSDGHTGVDEVLDEMAARSMNVLRVWAFNDQGERTWDCLQCAPNAQLTGGDKPSNYFNENTFQGMDELLAEANDRDIRVVMTLVNNWDDFGGMNRYAEWRGGGADHDDFYTDTTIKGWFKDYVDIMANRVNTVNGRTYKEDPTIFSWELANEARADSGAAGDVDDWIGEMSAYIKSVDPNHMVTTGVEGFYGPANNSKNSDSWMQFDGTDYINNHSHSTIDYATAHAWAQNWGWDPIGDMTNAMNKAIAFVQQRVDDAENILDMPFMLEEFGIPRNNFGTGIDSGPTTIRDDFFEDIYLGLQETSALAGGAFGGTASWIVFDNPTAAYDDQNGIFLPQDSNTDAIISAHAASLAGLTFGLAGDYNGNDIIDAADYTAWRDAMTAGASELLNDPTPGTVDESDFVYWRDHFGEVLGSGPGAGEAATATVPEPTGVLLLVIGALLSTVYRGRLR